MDEKNYQVRIEGIDIIGKSLYKFQIFEKDTFGFNIKTQLVGDSEKKVIVVFVAIEIKRLNDKNDLLAEMLVGIGFIVENFTEVFNKDENGIHIIPAEFENMVKTISISTVRGIMFSEFRGTQLHKAILPIILTDKFVPTEENIYQTEPVKKL
jgi:hypothetical protein